MLRALVRTGLADLRRHRLQTAMIFLILVTATASLALARALINRPAVLLADEPTGNLDTQATREVLALLSRRHGQGQTILLVTHDARVASVADRVISMRDGRIVDDTPLAAAPLSGEDDARLLSSLIRLEA